ncbi:hypothetical protein [Nitratireductor sp. ZSWI3]|uniref:hypothetical protein n=1 Tax=Nitratireductor sp. ZSWI3 TaxID=2966359 RepID=UPI00214F8EBC|nr:hypothetical protein [Nitratireductor sp. ZSWI3]MCR4265441.1 hypothetical protein [Nitratireductor sp. ZSWI3]
MSRIFTILLSLYWGTSFATAAWAALPADGVAVGTPWWLAGAFGLVLANALVAVLFAWSLIAALLECEANRVETEQVTRLACGGAVVVLLATALEGALLHGRDLTGQAESAALLAILVSHLVIHLETRDWKLQETRVVQLSDQPATSSARNAMHGSLIGRLVVPWSLARSLPATDDRGR